jgi:hypothetical protein
MLKIIIIVVIFILGLMFFCRDCLTGSSKTGIAGLEGFENKYSCPNILIKKDNSIFLYNSKLAKVPGVNPIKFDTLEDYVQFLEWQRSQNIECPVLYLEQTYDTQNNEMFTASGNPFLQPDATIQLSILGKNPEGVTALDNAGYDNPPYNQNQHPAFDRQNQYIGLKTPMDKMFQDSSNTYSPNAMDTNWGGVGFSRGAVKQGEFADDNVKIAVA